MKILITSQSFYPSIGGLNPIADLSAREFIRRGYEVRLLTKTTGTYEGEKEIEIIRGSGFRAMLEHYKWCDVVFQNHVSIRFALPLLFNRRPLVVSMSGWVNARAGASTGKWSLRNAIVSSVLACILRNATRNIAACAAVAAANRVPARVIPNPFDARTFSNQNRPHRSRDLLFVGRIITDKGVDDLVRALALVRKDGFDIGLVIAGEGGARSEIEELARTLGLAEKVRFAGPMRGRELVDLMNAHQVMVVPSKWNEPIGIVALEAIACGCVVIGSEGGGLAVTIGRCGLTYPNGDHEALAARITEVLRMEGRLEKFTAPAQDHLARYHPERVCGEYLDELEKALRDHTDGNSRHA
jgi:glycosyltransferase involved in cell wall biosynthesis